MAAMLRLAMKTVLGLGLAAGPAAAIAPAAAAYAVPSAFRDVPDVDYASFRRAGRHWRHHALRPPARIRVRFARRRAYRAIRHREEEIAAWRREFGSLRLRTVMSAE